MAEQPVNPLVGNLTTVTIVRSGDTQEVQGMIVKPGLAITPSNPDKVKPGRARFSLTHVPSGLGFRMRLCGVHVQEVAAIAAGSDVDWTVDKEAVVAAIQAADLLKNTRFSCFDSYCDGDGPEPPSYGVRCQTCDWDWFEECDEGSLSREGAERAAMDHECEPWIEIHSPITGKWHEKWSLSDAESKATSEQARDAQVGDT